MRKDDLPGDGSKLERTEGNPELKEPFQLAIDTIPGLVWSAQPDGHIDFLNQRWRDYTGMTLAEACGWGWQAAIPPEDLAGLMEYWKGVLASGAPGETEARLRGADGVNRWFLFRAVPLYDEAGKLIKWYGTNTDIQDRKWAEALLAGEKRILEMISRWEPVPVLMETLCHVVEEISEEIICSILLLDEKGVRLTLGAAPSLPSSYTGELKGLLDSYEAGPCARAASLMKPVIIADVLEDEPSVFFRELAVKHGLRACWTTPVFSSSGQVLGTFALYSRIPSLPSAQQERMIGQMSHLAAVAIERSQEQEKLKRSEAYLARAQSLSSTGSFCWNVSTQEMVWSDETYRICEVDRSVTPTGELTRDLIHPEDVGLFFQMLSGHETDYRFECRLRLPSGKIKHLQVDGAAVENEQGQRVEWIGNFMDITARKLADEALRASEHLARGQLNALKKTLDALSQESEPDHFLAHVLGTLTEEMEAHSVSVWEMNPTVGQVELVANFEDSRIQLPAKLEPPRSKAANEPRDHPVWTEFFREGKHCVVGMLDADPPMVRLEDGQNTDAHHWYGDQISDPQVGASIKRLAELGIITTLCVPLLLAGKVTGLVSIRFQQRRTFRREEVELTRALTHHVMLAVYWMRLSRQSRETAVVAERNRMARDIHDTLAQGFTGVIVQLEAAEDAKSKGLYDNVDHHIQRARELARESLKEARRSVQALRPQALEERSLPEALEALSQKMTFGTPMRVSFVLEGNPRPLPAECEGNLLRISQEALTNAVRHAQAGEFIIRLSFTPQRVTLELSDDGSGFDPAAKSDGFGLLGIRERVEAMGGELALISRPGHGTVHLISLPLSSASSSLL
ncbi:PAS domain S-box-containing protein [Prosthecobacter fusiformis]|uniref:Oxygen sensor histidine kinase NreB n=1 Tax=Prosthecobacter fusiformis TaxID=48464 RepID=A0A4R7RNE9_9BACT|nr:GAF domain-containing protein [Prosthecobacter fusiformis]TDU66116.1 PAS domain S-box-containing protein [Prosthecobacter fusiformis]